MNSRLIYTANERMKREIFWSKVTDTEWIYYGIADEIDYSIVIKNINAHFSDALLYISSTRQESFETTKNNILKATKNILGYQDFVIWNQSFDRAIEFNKIGVLRCGKI